MAIKLYEDQEIMLNKLRGALPSVDSVLLRAPTGAGKTICGATMANGAHKKGKRAIFLVHRNELLMQSSRAFSKFDIPHGLIAAGFTPNRHADIQIASIQTIVRRLDRIDPFDLVVVDEAHHASAATWKRVIDHLGGKRVGLTATPIRRDGTGLNDMFDFMVEGPSEAELMDIGRLTRFRAFAPSIPDVSSVRTIGGEFDLSELAKVMEKPSIVGNAVQHYGDLTLGRRAIMFCVNIERSLAAVEAFNRAGIPAEHVDGNTSATDREAATARFAAGKTMVLSNVGLFGEGYDVPAAEVLIDLAPTHSLGNAMQRWGRVLRPFYADGYDLFTADGRLAAIDASPKQYAWILDHSGNTQPVENGGQGHGLPNTEREWTLEGRRKRKRQGVTAPPLRQCPTCFRTHPPQPTCPRCGFEYPSMGRTIEELEGELAEITAVEMKKLARVEVGRARTLDELIAIGRARGYKDPVWWAKCTINGRAHKHG